MAAITSQTFQHSAPLSIPRGARLAAEAFTAGARFLRHWLAAAPAARRTRADEAEEVRALARGWEKTDPGFAADLYAAAARHEGQAQP